MTNPPQAARIAALTFGGVEFLGLMFHGGDFSPELLIHIFPMGALVAAGAAPNRWYRLQPARSMIAFLAVAALPLIAVSVYDGITLINGSDWAAVFVRSLEFLLLLLFLWVAVSSPREDELDARNRS